MTILREFQQGPAEMLFVLPSGAFDPTRHTSHLHAAQAELSEEVSINPSCLSVLALLQASTV